MLESRSLSRGRFPRLFFIVAAVLCLAGAGWILVHLMHPARMALPKECPHPALLAHRSNSVQLATAAARRGFCGLEVDVQWRDKFGIVVGHDELPPNWTPAGALTLAGLLDSIPVQPFLLWLDFKNLSEENATRAARYLEGLTVQHHLQNRVIVESKSPGALWLLYHRTRLIPAYWIPPRPQGRRGVIYDARLALVLGGLALPALSIPKKQLTPEFAARFRRFALFTWTCNTPAEVRTAMNLGASIILTDQPSLPITRARLPG